MLLSAFIIARNDTLVLYLFHFHISMEDNNKLYRSDFYLEIDECTENIDYCDHLSICANTVGSFTCTCKDGYQGQGNTCNGK